MAPPPPSKLYSDDVSLIVLLLDTNPYFWTVASNPSSPLSFSTFLSHVLSFLNSILLLNQLNQIVVIATGYNSCGYVYDSSLSSLSKWTQSSGNGVLPGFCEALLGNLEGFLEKDEKLSSEESVDGVPASLGLCQWRFVVSFLDRCDGKLSRRSFVVLQDQNDAMILSLYGSPDGSEQYVAVMNAIFSAQRSMAAALSKYKPYINPTSLISELQQMGLTAARALECFHDTRHIVLYYEDLVRNSTKLVDVQDFLGLPHMNLTSHQVKIHKGPLFDHISNWDDVNKMLTGTAYESLLYADY
ncbi:General transcription and DNA repair factor IIH subunit TFB4-like protein [Drosera capensis]